MREVPGSIPGRARFNYTLYVKRMIHFAPELKCLMMLRAEDDADDVQVLASFLQANMLFQILIHS